MDPRHKDFVYINFFHCICYAMNLKMLTADSDIHHLLFDWFSSFTYARMGIPVAGHGISNSHLCKYHPCLPIYMLLIFIAIYSHHFIKSTVSCHEIKSLSTVPMSFATTFTEIEFPVDFINDTKLDIMLRVKQCQLFLIEFMIHFHNHFCFYHKHSCQ